MAYSLKIFSRINGPISIKLDTNHPCIKEYEACIYKWPVPLQEEIIPKIGWGYLFFFSRITGPEKLRFT
jgi:hypothetical protein